jgi:hypothetical protein
MEKVGSLMVYPPKNRTRYDLVSLTNRVPSKAIPPAPTRLREGHLLDVGLTDAGLSAVYFY